MRSFAQLHTVSSYAIWLGLCSVKVFTFIYGVHSAFRKYTSVQKNRNNRQQQQQLKIYLTSIVLHCYEFGNVRSKMFENELLLPRNRKVFHVHVQTGRTSHLPNASKHLSVSVTFIK